MADETNVVLMTADVLPEPELEPRMENVRVPVLELEALVDSVLLIVNDNDTDEMLSTGALVCAV